MNFDLSSIQQSAGTYYNSVTDSYQNVPTGAPSTGNGGTKTPAQTGVWHALAGVGSSVASSVESGYDSAKQSVHEAVSSVSDSVSSAASGVMNTYIKWLLIIFGAGLVLIWVVGKSGIVGQAAPVAGMYMGAR